MTFRVNIPAQFQIRRPTTLRLSATVYYIKSQSPSIGANIFPSCKLGMNWAVPSDQISLVMYTEQLAQKKFLYDHVPLNNIQEHSLHIPLTDVSGQTIRFHL
jgi:hypothetical protein